VSQEWMEVVRPALKRKMQRVQANETEQLRYNLLAIVEDRYQKASDVLEMLKRERNQLERRLKECYAEGWHDKAGEYLALSMVHC
jgi:ubiquitin carboxyl-terminal hydrolase L5